MGRFLFPYILLLFCFSSATASDPAVLGEKLYFITDRETYFPGDTLSLSGLLVDESTLLPQVYSNYIDIELINNTDSVLLRCKAAVQEGVFHCALPLDWLLTTGIYYIRGYTQFMRNSRQETFPIIPFFIGENITLPTPNVDQPSFVEFYPESGNWVGGKLQRMAFSVKDEKGWPLTTHAMLMDESGDTLITAIPTSANGLGLFHLEPDPMVNYFLHFPGSATVYPLPRVSETPSFRIDLNQNRLHYAFHPAKTNDRSSYRLMLWYRGTCYTEQQLNANKNQGIIILPENLEGILACILVDEKERVCGERLIYISSQKETTLLSPVSGNYSPGEEIEFDTTGWRINPAVMIGRIQPEKRAMPHLLQNTLPASLLLTSEASSAIYAPASYLHPQFRAAELDILMLSLKWGRRYWKDLLNPDSLTYPFPPEEVMSITGTVKRENNKAITEGLIIGFNNENGLTYDADIAQDGTFTMGVDDFTNGHSFFIQPYDAKDRSDNLIIEITKKSLPSVTNPLKKLIYPTQYQNNTHSQDFLSYHEEGKRIVQVPEITVKAKLKTKVLSTEEFYKAHHLSSKELETYATIDDILSRLRLKVVRYVVDDDGKQIPIKPKIITRRRGEGELVILVDGIRHDANYVLDFLNPRDIESVTELTATQALVYARHALNGALHFKTRSYKKEEIKPMGILYQPEGLSPLEGFNNQSMIFTQNPENKNMTLTAPDKEGNYHLILEGIDQDGSPFSYIYPFNVKSK